MVFAAEAFGFGVILIANLTAIQGFVNILSYNFHFLDSKSQDRANK